MARSTQWNHPAGAEGGGGGAEAVGETGGSAGADPRQPGQRVHISQDDNLSRVSVNDSMMRQEGILEAMRGVSISQSQDGGSPGAANAAGSGSEDTTDSGSGRTAAASSSASGTQSASGSYVHFLAFTIVIREI